MDSDLFLHCPQRGGARQLDTCFLGGCSWECLLSARWDGSVPGPTFDAAHWGTLHSGDSAPGTAALLRCVLEDLFRGLSSLWGSFASS